MAPALPNPRKPDAAQWWKKWLARALDVLYPAECGLCQTPLTHGRALCDNCRDDLPKLRAPFCLTCGESYNGEIDTPFTCPNCSALKLAFDFARPATCLDPRTRELIHRLKYGRELHLAADLGQLAFGAFDDPRLAPALAEGWPLIPVPLHRRRLQERHFNQAEEISRSLSRLTGLPIIKALKRTRHTPHQTTLTRRQRLENLRGAFAITAAGRRHIRQFSNGAVLIDDVLTTGSTVHECAKTLRRAGLKQICVVTVMRG